MKVGGRRPGLLNLHVGVLLGLSMGYCPYYQAIPEDSDLFRRLQSDRQLAIVMDQFFPRGACPFDIDEAGQEEVEETLDWIAEREGELFKSRADAEGSLAELKSVIQRAEQTYPGLIARTAFLNKSQDEIEERLARRLSSIGRDDATALVQTLLFGRQVFAPGIGASLIPSIDVAEAAGLLREIEPDSLFDPSEGDYPREDYQSWRDLFLEAAKRGEAILVY